jgi:hypothetical protein
MRLETVVDAMRFLIAAYLSLTLLVLWASRKRRP